MCAQELERECKGNEIIFQTNLFHGKITKDNGTFFEVSVRRQNKTPVPTAKRPGSARTKLSATKQYENNRNYWKGQGNKIFF